ncbi:solute carrier family 22 member 15-like isoform X3 [Nematostella vectensis]|uniref:solute carrier family 22 member 15-like isoform X3 n=1 Tax=Nematostella vectensis TaxID=45351 RepID=UPI00138FC309|nr:solute carrier family 22 member 15-like isoform X3 [Nematostella vectensis]
MSGYSRETRTYHFTEDKMSSNTREFDEVFHHVKEFGPYQFFWYNFLYAFTTLPMMPPLTNILFAMGIPDFHCADDNTTCSANTCCDNCTNYAYDGPFTSVASEWDLICDKAAVVPLLQMMFYVGSLLLSPVIGPLSDRFGRKKCLFGSMAIAFCGGLGSAFANSVPLFGFMEFVLGCGYVGVVLSVYTLNMELVGPARRTLAGNLNEFYWTFSSLFSMMLVYLIREWRTLVWVSALPCLVLLFLYPLVPRSPRWLVAHGHLDEAMTVLLRFGGKNNKAVDQVKLRALVDEIRANQTLKESDKTRRTPIDLLRTPKMRKWIMILSYNWFVTNLVSNALFLVMLNLAGNLYLNSTLYSVVVVPMLPFTWLLMKSIGRRLTNAVLFALCAVICILVSVFPDKGMLTTGLAITGFAFVYGTWTTTYILTTELFPTVIRNTALSAGSTVGRLGGIISPYIAMIGSLNGMNMSLPMGIFAGLTSLAVMATYWLPETKFSPMHQTIEEAEEAVDYYGIPCCERPAIATTSSLIT